MTIVLEAIYHRAKQNWSYAYDRATLHIRIRTKRDNVEQVHLFAGDKYIWEESSAYIPMIKFASDSLFDYWQAEIKPPFRRLRYGFRLQSGTERIWMTEVGFHQGEPEDSTGMFEFPFINPADVFTPPAWVKDAVFYQIFPERFANGDPANDPADVEPWGGDPTPTNYFGGDLQGVIDHLDHLTDLGINAVYFNPLFEAETNHKYDTTDYKKIDPHFGTNDTLKRLVEACHKRGIRVLLDAVFNHSGSSFAPFVDVVEKGAASVYADWFHIREFPVGLKDGIPTFDTFAFDTSMPKLNTENPGVQDYLLDVAEYWIKEVGIDGWRIDVANEVDHRFWRLLRDRVKALRPDAYLLGEIWHDSMPWLQGDQFDAVMNYPFTGAVLDFAAKGKLDAAGFANTVGAQLASYPWQINETTFNLLGSHDTPRLLTICGEDKRMMKLATALQFVFPGAPCIYYGDEVGMAGDGDPDCRRCMIWDTGEQDRELFAFFQRIIRLRLSHEALRSGSLRFLSAQPGGHQLVIERATARERLLILFNAASKNAVLSVPADTAQWNDLWSSRMLAAEDGLLHVELPAYGFAILQAAAPADGV